jgi:hypothetical protein
MPDILADPIFGVPGGTLNVLTATSILVITAQSVDVHIGNPPPPDWYPPA